MFISLPLWLVYTGTIHMNAVYAPHSQSHHIYMYPSLRPRKTLHEQKHKIQLSCTVLREEVTETYFYNPVAFITIKNMQPVQQVKNIEF